MASYCLDGKKKKERERKNTHRLRTFATAQVVLWCVSCHVSFAFKNAFPGRNWMVPPQPGCWGLHHRSRLLTLCKRAVRHSKWVCLTRLRGLPASGTVSSGLRRLPPMLLRHVMFNPPPHPPDRIIAPVLSFFFSPMPNVDCHYFIPFPSVMCIFCPVTLNYLAAAPQSSGAYFKGRAM